MKQDIVIFSGKESSAENFWPKAPLALKKCQTQTYNFLRG